MKRQILLLLFAVTQLLYGQVTLENIYPNTIGSTKFLLYTHLDANTPKFILFDPLNSQFTIYNLDHSIYDVVTIPISYLWGSSQYQIAYVTKSLFDCDSSNIEYALSFLGDGGLTSYPKAFYVYRTDGTQLENIDSVCFLNFSDGLKYGPEYNKPIINTPLGTKLILRHLDGSTRIYSICGETTVGMASFEDDFILGNPFPNPTNDLITIPYTLHENEKKGTIKIYNSTGLEVKSLEVDDSFDNVILSTSEFPSGGYYYHVITSKGTLGAKKIFKVD